MQPSLFQSPDFSKIDEDKEGLLDFCPICNEQLPDKKVKTFKIHEWNNHRKTDAERLKQIQRNTNFLAILGLMMLLIPIAASAPFWLNPIIDDMDLDGWTYEDECRMERADLLVRAYENNGFVASDLETFNHLENNCGMLILLYPPDDPEEEKGILSFGDEDDEISTVFNDEESYEINKEALADYKAQKAKHTQQ